MPAADLARSIVDTLASMDVRPRIIDGRLRAHLDHLRPADAADARALIVEHRDRLIEELEARGAGIISRRRPVATPTLGEARDPFEVRLDDGTEAAELEDDRPWWSRDGFDVQAWLLEAEAWVRFEVVDEQVVSHPRGPYTPPWVCTDFMQLKRAGVLADALRSREAASVKSSMDKDSYPTLARAPEAAAEAFYAAGVV